MFAYEIGHRAWWYMQIENSRVHVLGEILGYRMQKARQAETALACIRRTIGNCPRYDDLRACLDVQEMTAAEMEAIASMTADEMIIRWARETGYEAEYEQMRKQEYR